MDLEQIEEEYKQELERSREVFLKSDSSPQIEKKYRASLQSARQKYEKNMLQCLKKEQYKKIKKSLKYKSLPLQKFKAQTAPPSPTTLSRAIRLHWSKLLFRTRLFLAHPLPLLIESKVKYLSEKIKGTLRSAFHDLARKTRAIKTTLTKKIVLYAQMLKEKTMVCMRPIVNKIKETVQKITPKKPTKEQKNAEQTTKEA